MSAVATPVKKRKTAAALTKASVLKQYHDRCAIVHEAERNDLVTHEEVERLIDRYRIEATELLAQVPTGEEIRAKQHAAILLSHEQEIDEFLADLLQEKETSE